MFLSRDDEEQWVGDEGNSDDDIVDDVFGEDWDGLADCCAEERKLPKETEDVLQAALACNVVNAVLHDSTGLRERRKVLPSSVDVGTIEKSIKAACEAKRREWSGVDFDDDMANEPSDG